MEQIEMNDGFEKKRGFIVMDFSKPPAEQVVFSGEADSLDEAKEIVEGKKDIKIDFENDPNIEIQFENAA